MASNSKLALVLGLAAVAGVIVGQASATPAQPPEPTLAVAAVPTSTPDLRPTLPPQTVTPTLHPTPAPSRVVVVAPPPTVAGTPAPTPLPTATPEARGRAVVWFARPGLGPTAVDAPEAIKDGTTSTRVFYRILALRQMKTDWPAGTVNLVGAMRAKLLETGAGEGFAVIGFAVPDDGDWGVPADQVPLLLQQIVWTATEEPGIDLVRITQNGGETAVIAGRKIIEEMTRGSTR